MIHPFFIAARGTDRSMRIFCLFSLLVLFSINAFAQSGKITGNVVDSATHQAIEYATLTVAEVQSKKVINGAATDVAGKFEVAGLPMGQYIVTVDFIGYSKKTIEASITSARQIVSLNTISLS